MTEGTYTKCGYGSLWEVGLQVVFFFPFSPLSFCIISVTLLQLAGSQFPDQGLNPGHSSESLESQPLGPKGTPLSITFIIRKGPGSRPGRPGLSGASPRSLSPRLTHNLDGVVIELLFRQSKISEVLGGSGYNADRLCVPYIPQLTGRSSARALPSLPLAFLAQVRAGMEGDCEPFCHLPRRLGCHTGNPW